MYIRLTNDKILAESVNFKAYDLFFYCSLHPVLNRVGYQHLYAIRMIQLEIKFYHLYLIQHGL